MFMDCSGKLFQSSLLLLLLLLLRFNSCNGYPDTRCKEIERKALLKFKEGIKDHTGRLSSWTGKDCCRWRGVGCSNGTGRVVKLNLRNPFQFRGDYPSIGYESYKKSRLSGEINPSLLSLKYLNYLDLSMNYFPGIHIPHFLGSLEKLMYLNLSNAFCFGTVPPHLGNLSNLLYLDLSCFVCPYQFGLHMENLHWISRLSSLEYLNMEYVNISNAADDWLQPLNKLSLLQELKLSHCELQRLPPYLPLVNFTSLLVLDLSGNYFNSSLPLWLFNISSLVDLDLSGNIINLDLSYNTHSGDYKSNGRALGSLCKLRRLDLSNNNGRGGEVGALVDSLSAGCTNKSLEILLLQDVELSGHLPISIGRLLYLKELDLSGNQISGPIPESLGQLSALVSLYLYWNQFSGPIPESLGQLSKLVSLELHGNYWEGAISEHHFTNLTNLKYLSISSWSRNNSLVFDVRQEWVPPFKLDTLEMFNFRVGPQFPQWFKTQNLLTSVFLRNVSISDTIPEWFWKLFSLPIRELGLSNNRLCGSIPNINSLRVEQQALVDLSSNCLGGTLSILLLWNANLSHLSLRNNSFSGSIPSNIGQKMPLLSELDLSSNQLSGNIPSSIAKMKLLYSLSLSNNHLSGELSFDWKGLQSLTIIDLSNNNLSGKILSSIGSLHLLERLILSNNSFYGELPSSLKHCTSLYSLDLGKNNFSGILPTWIGENLPYLMMLRLRANSFVGKIPQQLCHLTYLHILDLAQNNFSGFIPTCLGNLSGMTIVLNYSFGSTYDEHMMIVAKGRELEYYSEILNEVNVVDLSSNNLSGNIPPGITLLSELKILNLSTNRLTGKIPGNIGKLKSLESLDLSRNQFSGEIPPSISSLNFLSRLNLSNNNLSGRIPFGNQLQTLNESSVYVGNPKLCGPPLTNKCPGDETPQIVEFSPRNGNGEEEENNQSTMEMLWFYCGMAFGFVMGFWGVWGCLLLKKSWRRAYFRFLGNIMDRVFVVVALNLARLHRLVSTEVNE